MAETLEKNPDLVADNQVRLEEIVKLLIEHGDRVAKVNTEQQQFYYNISQQLSLLGDTLNNTEKYELVVLLDELSYASTTAESASVPLGKFVRLVSKKARISAETVKTTIRLFLQMCYNNTLSNVVKEVINSSSAMENIPSEVETMGSESINLYYQALSLGYHHVKDIRLMIVGMCGVGKTSLLRNIVDVYECQGTTYQNKSPESTVGIDVIHCEVLNDGRWRQTHNTGSSAADKFRQILTQMKQDGNIDDSTDSAGALPSLQNKTEQPLTSSDVLQDSSGSIIYPRSQADQQQGHSDLADFKKKLSSIDDPNFVTFMHDVMAKVTDPKLSLVSDTRVAVWDFAGQSIYYSTHHFFLNSRSIYLLLMDVSKPLNSLVEEIDEFSISGFMHKEFTRLEAFKFWLRSIYMYHTTQMRDTSVKPSIILVGTHKDKLNGNDVEKERQKEDFFNEALKSFLDSPILKLVRRRKFLVNNRNNNADYYENIRLEVLNAAKEQNYWNEKRPAKWIRLERSLEGLKEEGKEIISFDELKKEDQKNEMPLKSESELKLFLHFQHSLGNLLFFESELLQRCIILTPQWIIDAFRCFISHMPDKNPEQLSLWDDYEQRAILSYELIDEIIDKNPDNKCFRDYKNEIVGYMELLDIIARPVDILDHDQLTEGCFGDSHGDEHNLADHGVSNGSSNLQSRKDFYIVPLRLRSRPEEEKLSEWLNPAQAKSKTPIIAMVFKDWFLPPSVFHRLLAICITKWPVQKTGRQLLLYNGFAGFRITRTSTLTIWFQDHIVYGRVCSYEDETDSRHICVEARHFLSNSLKSILSIMPNKGGYGKVLLFDEFIQCHHIATFKPGVGLIRLRDLLFDVRQLCEDCEEAHVMSRDEGLGLWCNLESVTLSKDVLLRCPTPTELVQIALSCIGDEYFRLGLELGITDKRLEHIRDVDRFHAPTRIYHMLVEAKRLKERDAKLTVQMLRNGMIAVGADVTAYDKLLEKSGTEDANTFDECLNDCTLSKLSECIGDEYWLLGIVLGLDEIRIQQLREEYKQPPVRNYNILLEWKKLNSNASTCALLNAMKLVGSDYSKAETICSTPMSE